MPLRGPSPSHPSSSRTRRISRRRRHGSPTSTATRATVLRCRCTRQPMSRARCRCSSRCHTAIVGRSRPRSRPPCRERAISWDRPSRASNSTARGWCSAGTSVGPATPCCVSRNPSATPTGSWWRAPTVTGRTTIPSRWSSCVRSSTGPSRVAGPWSSPRSRSTARRCCCTTWVTSRISASCRRCRSTWTVPWRWPRCMCTRRPSRRAPPSCGRPSSMTRRRSWRTASSRSGTSKRPSG